jgi:hypothetical protein
VGYCSSVHVPDLAPSSPAAAAQVTQARCYEAATAFWRRIKTDSDANTMGVLYWQLNDVWQVRPRMPFCGLMRCSPAALSRVAMLSLCTSPPAKGGQSGQSNIAAVPVV